jgi:hypothetical protein
MNPNIIIFLVLTLAGLVFSLYRFYKEKAYRVMLSFTAIGLVVGYYAKGLTDAKLASGGGIGTEGLFVAVTVIFIFILDGVIGQFLSIMLKKPYGKPFKIGLSIGGTFVILSSLMLLLRLAA